MFVHKPEGIQSLLFRFARSMPSLNFSQSGAVDLQFGGLGAVRSRFFGIAGVQF